MTDTLKFDIAIIGAGTAGMHAYDTASATGASVVLIEKGDGGTTCTRSGCIPSKLLIAAGRAAHAVATASEFGVEVPPATIDGAAVLRRVRRERDAMDGNIRDKFQAIPEAHRLKGTARFVAADALEVAGRTVHARSIIVAAGAEASVPESLLELGDIVHTHETIFELDDVPRRLAIVGAGPIGLELAQAFARLGVETVVFDEAERIGAICDNEAERALRTALEREFAITLGVEIAAQRTERTATLSWTGASSGTVEVDCILAATGRKPDLADLHLEAAGIELDADGVPLFDPATRRCGSSSIFVAGDVDGWRPVLHEAARGGRIAAAMATGGTACPQIPDLAIAFTEPGLAEIGCRFDALPSGTRIGTAKLTDNARATIDATEAGLVRLYGAPDGKLIGGTIVAAGAEHLGQSVALAISAGMSVERFLDQAWYHPVIEETLQSAARDLLKTEDRA